MRRGSFSQWGCGDLSIEFSRVAGDMSRPTPPTYKTKNWQAYSEALKRRDLRTVWFDSKMTCEAEPIGERGRQHDCRGEEGRKTVR